MEQVFEDKGKVMSQTPNSPEATPGGLTQP